MQLPHDFRDTCSFALTDGTSLAVRQSLPATEGERSSSGTERGQRRTVLLVHGLGEHSGRYREVAEAFAGAGFRFVAYDQRGHGKSAGRRCDCQGLDQLCLDLDQVIQRISRGSDQEPIVLYGHSFGGMVVLWYLLTHVKTNSASVHIEKSLVTSPLIHAESPPSRFVVKLGRIAASVWPTLTFYAQIKGEQLSQVPHYVERFMADPLCQGRVTARMGRELLDSGDQLLAKAHQLTIPVQLHHGDADPVTSWKSSQEFCELAGDHCEFVSWSGQRHELHHEPVRQELIEHMIAWLQSPAIDKDSRQPA